MNELGIRDRLYCRSCVYKAPDTGEGKYLCDYLSQVGHSRGCPPGEKCTRRALSQKSGRNPAERMRPEEDDAPTHRALPQGGEAKPEGARGRKKP